jgi:DNA mismatch repair protein MutL
MRIKQLSPYLANQIAAGEVIERPASVLKELLENSLDAGATYIELEVEKGGLKQLRVTDNGSGIHKDDLLLAVTPHATSKLQVPDDLFNIHTLGFRGEALASIGSVARLQLTSCQNVAAGAWELSVAGDALSSVMPTAHPVGTTILVQDLFFNTPARRKFLRSDKTEFSQLEEVFRRIVLSHYEVGFSFKHNQRPLYQLPAVQNTLAQEKRIAKIFGSNFLQNALQIDFAIAGIKFWGWVGDAKFTRSQADLQYIYLNGRIIRDKLVNHALRSAYEDKLYPGRYPLFLLYIEIEPSKVDVNVHPTKHEVRFHDGRLVHDFLYQSIKETLTKAVTKLDDSVERQVVSQTGMVSNPYEISKFSLASLSEQLSTASYQATTHTTIRGLGMLHDKYLLAQHPEGLLLIDVQRALFSLSKGFYLQQGIVPKPLLIPQTLTLSEPEVALFEQYHEALQIVGINITTLSHNQITLRSIPNYLTKVNTVQFLTRLMDELKALAQINITNNILLITIAKVGSQAAVVSELDINIILRHLPQLQQDNAKICTVVSLDTLAKLLR